MMSKQYDSVTTCSESPVFEHISSNWQLFYLFKLRKYLLCYQIKAVFNDASLSG